MTRIISLKDGVVVPETDTKPVLQSETYFHKIERLGFAVKTLNNALREIGVPERVILYTWTPDEEDYESYGAEAGIRIRVTGKGGGK